LDCNNNKFNSGYANSQKTSCACHTGYVWDETTLICIRDCSTAATPNSKGTNYEFLSCECNPNYQWDYATSACLPYQNCTAMANSPGTNVNSNSCNCNAGYVWNGSWTNTVLGGACQRNCSSVANSNGSIGQDPLSCNCMVGYIWAAALN